MPNHERRERSAGRIFEPEPQRRAGRPRLYQRRGRWRLIVRDRLLRRDIDIAPAVDRAVDARAFADVLVAGNLVAQHLIAGDLIASHDVADLTDGVADAEVDAAALRHADVRAGELPGLAEAPQLRAQLCAPAGEIEGHSTLRNTIADCVWPVPSISRSRRTLP